MTGLPPHDPKWILLPETDTVFGVIAKGHWPELHGGFPDFHTAYEYAAKLADEYEYVHVVTIGTQIVTLETALRP